MALSPDGEWALSTLPDSRQISLLPTGAGEARKLITPGVSHSFTGNFLPDGKRVVFFGSETGRPERLYVQDIAGGRPRPIAPEGTRSSREQNGVVPVSPDGKFVAARGPDQTISLYPVEGGSPRPIPGLLPGAGVVRWTADGRALYVWAKGHLPARIFKVDLSTGRREPWKELAPEDRAGAVQNYGVCLTPDGTSYAYGCVRTVSDLFVVDGLR